MNMRFFTIVLLGYVSCSGGKILGQSFSINEFSGWAVERQANEFNALNQEGKVRFLTDFIPGRTFMIGPTAQMVFLKNGRAIVVELGRNWNGPLEFVNWKTTTTAIVVWKENLNLAPELNEKETWTNPRANENFHPNSTPDSRRFFLIFRRESGGQWSLDFEKGGCESPAVQEYCRDPNSGC